MSDRLQEIVETFASVDEAMRLELLLDFSKKLRPLPRHLLAQANDESHRVHECMTPVFLWIESDQDGLHLHAQIAEEAPTVKGFVSILQQGLEHATADDVHALPTDLLEQLGLHRTIRMNRVVGLNAVLARIKREATLAAAR